MKMETIVKKYTRPIMLVFVVVIALALVLTFAPGQAGGGGDAEKPAGTLVDGTEIPYADWDVYRRRSMAYHKLERFHAQSVQQELIASGRIHDRNELEHEFNTPSREHLIADAWELMLVLRRADELKITATSDEVKAETDGIVQALMRPKQNPPADEVNKKLSELFHLDRKEFEAFIEDLLRYRKAMGLMGFGYAGGFPTRPTGVFEYPTFEEASKAQRPERARLFCAFLSPSDFETLADPVSSKQIEEENGRRPMESKPRARVDFIIAEYDRYNDRVTPPTDAELEDFYQRNKESYRIVEDEEPADGAQVPPKYKPFADVKEEIRKRLLRDKTGAFAKNDIQIVAGEIVTKLAAAKTEDEKREIGKTLSLAEIAEKAKLRYDVTPPVSDDDVETLNGLLGKPLGDERRLAELIAEGASEGKIYCVPQERTDRGVAILRIRERFAPVPRELDSDARRVVERRCAEMAQDEKARKVAEEIGKKMKAGLSFADAIRSWEAKGVRPTLLQTPFFNVAPRELFTWQNQWAWKQWVLDPKNALPVEPPALGEDLHRFAALAAKGMMRVDDFQVPDKGPVYYCVYLEDKIDVPSEDFLKDVKDAREARPDLKARKEFLDGLMKSIKSNNVLKN